MEQAGKAVRQLGSLLFEMEVLRSFLETEAELRYFDNRVSPSKVLAHRVVNNLKGTYICIFREFLGAFKKIEKVLLIIKELLC